MDWFTGIAVYIVIWWTVIFCVLPWGSDRDSTQETGTGSPANPRLKEKFLITTGVSLLVWLLVYGLIHAEVINFRDLSQRMFEEDFK